MAAEILSCLPSKSITIGSYEDTYSFLCQLEQEGGEILRKKRIIQKDPTGSPGGRFRSLVLSDETPAPEEPQEVDMDTLLEEIETDRKTVLAFRKQVDDIAKCATEILQKICADPAQAKNAQALNQKTKKIRTIAASLSIHQEKIKPTREEGDEGRVLFFLSRCHEFKSVLEKQRDEKSTVTLALLDSYTRTRKVFEEEAMLLIKSDIEQQNFDGGFAMKCLNEAKKVQEVLTISRDPAEAGDLREKFFARVTLDENQQGKHIKGHPIFEQLPISVRNSKSLLKEGIDIEKFINLKKGTGVLLVDEGFFRGSIKEAVEFEEEIGLYYDRNSATFFPTSSGTIHYDSKAKAHLVPGCPKAMRENKALKRLSPVLASPIEMASEEKK